MEEGLRTHLDALGIGDLYEVFALNDIEASMLAGLGDADLREMGLTLGQRKRVNAALAQLRPNLSPMSELQPERRQLTVLFCDLVGSTALAADLDPEDLRDLMASYHNTCATIMRQHDGHVAYLQGDGLMVCFGYPFAREDDPERAVRAGLDAAAAVAGLETPIPQRLAVRIGLATGLVVVGDLSGDGEGGEEMVIGETPNLASRLKDLAEPGQVIVPESTRRIAGALFEYERLGAFGLKGFPDPVTAYRVTRESPLESRFEARASVGLNPIIGRDDELNTLDAMWREALTGAGRLVLVRGEAGIGKSRLARAFAERIRLEPATVLKWYCASHLANRPLHPILREIERGAGMARESTAAQRRQRLSAALEAMPGLVRDDLPLIAESLGLEDETARALDPATRARKTTDALLRRTLAMTLDGPLLLIVEDAHWADAATQEFLDLLMARLERRPALVIITHRPDFAPPWAVEGRGRGIVLQRLDPSAGARLISMTVRERMLPDAVTQSILQKADGVPLFVEELTKSVLEAVLESGSVDAAFATLAVPTTLQDSLMARLDRLGPAKEVAQLGAVIGREFTADMIRVIAPPRCDVDGGLAQLQSAALTVRGGFGGPESWMFHHALVQDTAYESLLKKRRREIHASIAEAMLAAHQAFVGVEPEVIARHCSIGGMPDPAARHWLAAGAFAMDRAANLAAVTYLRAALEQIEKLPTGPERNGLELQAQMALGPACMAIHGWASPTVETACRRARDLAAAAGDDEKVFGATWGLWSNFFLRGEMDATLATAEEVANMAAQSSTPLLTTIADHALGYTRFFRGELDDALAHASSGKARFDMETERTIVRLFQLSSNVSFAAIEAGCLALREDRAGCLAAQRRSVELAEALAHAPTLALALGTLQHTLVMVRDWSALKAVAARLLPLGEEEGFALWIALANLCGLLSKAYTAPTASITAKVIEAFDAFRATGTTLAGGLHEPAIAELMIADGAAADALDQLDTAIANAERRSERLYLPELHRMRGEALLALGDRDSALGAMEDAIALAARQNAPALNKIAEGRLRDIEHGGTVPAMVTRRKIP